MTVKESPPLSSSSISTSWRLKERVKTVAGALCLCLHIGVPPPDQIRVEPCAHLECWLDPMGVPASVVDATGAASNADDAASSSVLVTNPAKTREAIGKALQSQYECWHPRAKYRLLLDTNTDELRKTLQALRKGAKRERVLLHYNGHGVPMPTQNGELWVFNRAFTQYIPVHVADIETWMGRPAIVVLDCAAAGRIVAAWPASRPSSPQASPTGSADVLVFAACGAEETLPTVADLPADLLTACLTTPVEMALRWHVYRRTSVSCTAHHSTPGIERARAIVHGKPSDRRTPLGHLTWIFTAITDALAWQTLPLDTFKSLFRQDLLVASLSRNFLLASRIGHACCISPASHPVNLAANPSIHQHDLWTTWDHCLDTVLTGLPCTFFADQVESFRLWIEHKWLASTTAGFLPPISRGIDDAVSRLEAIKISSKLEEAQDADGSELCPHLPIILQVLLSQEHRRDALHLLLAFCDLGPLAVLSALHVGAHPYIAKLLQSTAADIRPALMAIWLRVQIVDGDTATWDESQRELLREDAYRYFSNAVIETGRSFASAGDSDCSHNDDGWIDGGWIDETVTGLACLTALFEHGHATEGQRAVQDKNGMPEYLSELALRDARKNVRLWSLLLIGVAMRGATSPCKYFLPQVYERAMQCLREDLYPEVRAGAAFLLGAFADGTDEAETVLQMHTEIGLYFSTRVFLRDPPAKADREG